MVYVPAGKTHSTHAVKLCLAGSHTLFNHPTGQRIVFQQNDTEAQEIRRDGVHAVVFESSIWDDMAEVEALNALGNFNASIDEGEDEMQAFARIDNLILRMAQSP